MTKYDFALQWLDFLGNEVYNKGEQIFLYDGEGEYEITPLESGIRVGESFFDGEEKEEDFERMSFPEFTNLGYAVVSSSEFTWKPRQHVHYKIVRRTRNTIGITDKSFSAAKLQVQHDPPNRRIRIIGENVLADKRLPVHSGVGPWAVYDEDRPINHHHVKVDRGVTKEQSRAIARARMYGGSADEERIQQIKEIPVLFSDEKYIVCIQEQNTCQRLIVTGQSGMGKSLFTNAFSGRIFYKWENRVAWLIDPLNQLYNISAPQDFVDFIDLNRIINEEPKPIPAVQLYMACKNNRDFIHPNVSLRVVLDFVEFLRKYKFYVHGIKNMDVGDTIRYLNSFIDVIKTAKTGKQVRKALMDRVENAHKDKGKQSMIYKWTETFETIFKEGFTSNLYDDVLVTDSLKVKFADGKELTAHPFIACYEAGLVPVFNISACRTDKWVRNYLADLMQKIVKHQSNAGDNQKRVWIVADELNEIYEIGKRKDNASAAFEELFRQGRFNNIGFIGNTQSLERLNPEMIKNATHIACCYMQSSKERKMLGDMWDIPKVDYNKIASLKKFEMMLFSKQPFIIYDRWGRRKKVDDRKWFKGKIIPPINHHQIPKK